MMPITPRGFESPDEQTKITNAGLTQSFVCKAYQATVQSIPNNAWTAISLDAENFDPQRMHDNVVNNSRITIKATGIYLIVGQVSFAASAAGVRALIIRLNGATLLGGDIENGTSGAYTAVFTAALEQLNEGDYIEMQGYQNSGGALDTAASRERTNLAVVKVA